MSEIRPSLLVAFMRLVVESVNPDGRFNRHDFDMRILAEHGLVEWDSRWAGGLWSVTDEGRALVEQFSLLANKVKP